jgi:hypothetical protein
MNWKRLALPRKFSVMVPGLEDEVVLRVAGSRNCR